MLRDLSKNENKRENLHMKRNKLITKIHLLVNVEETNKTEKQIEIEAIEKSKNDSSRMFKAIKDLNKMKPKTSLLIKEGNQYTANKKQQVKLTAKHFQKLFNKYRSSLPEISRAPMKAPLMSGEVEARAIDTWVGGQGGHAPHPQFFEE